jgi:hypothetical protein
MHQRIGVALLALVIAACESGFSEEDIKQAEKSIRTEFEKQPGVHVTNVALIKESPNKLTGFVKMKFGPVELTKDCAATMGENRRYIWQCK